MTAPFDDSGELLRLINGFQISRALHVAACLPIADHLVDGARSITDLAAVRARFRGDVVSVGHDRF
jgi:hypothetical protein